MEILPGDLSDFSFGAKAAELVKSKFGKLDGLIVNHGILEPVKKVADVEVEEWRRLFDVNVFSAVGLVSSATPLTRGPCWTVNGRWKQIANVHVDQSMSTTTAREQRTYHPLLFWRGVTQLQYLGCLRCLQSSPQPPRRNSRD